VAASPPRRPILDLALEHIAGSLNAAINGHSPASGLIDARFQIIGC
jgi:hypothetical protein